MTEKSCYICKFSELEDRADPDGYSTLIICKKHDDYYWNDQSKNCKEYRGIYRNECWLSRKKLRKEALRHYVKEIKEQYGYNSIEELKTEDSSIYEIYESFKNCVEGKE